MTEGFWHLLVALTLLGVVLEGFALIAIARQIGSVLLQIGPPRAGTLKGGPEIGTAAAANGLLAGSPTMMFFLSSSCEPCEALRPSLPLFAKHHQEFQLFIALPEGDVSEEYEDQSWAAVLPEFSGLYEGWSIPGTPFIVVLDKDLVVRATGVANNLDQLEALAGAALNPVDNSTDASGNGHKGEFHVDRGLQEVN